MNLTKALLLLLVLLLSSCSSKAPEGGQMDYEATKKMVVDILKTDDGKKAIQQIMSDDKMKEKLVMDQKEKNTERNDRCFKKQRDAPAFTKSDDGNL